MSSQKECRTALSTSKRTYSIVLFYVLVAELSSRLSSPPYAYPLAMCFMFLMPKASNEGSEHRFVGIRA